MVTKSITKTNPYVQVAYQIRDALSSKEVEMTLRSMPKMTVSFFIRNGLLQKTNLPAYGISLMGSEDLEDEDDFCEIEKVVYDRLVKLVTSVIKDSHFDLTHQHIEFTWEYSMDKQMFIDNSLMFRREIHYKY